MPLIFFLDFLRWQALQKEIRLTNKEKIGLACSKINLVDWLFPLDSSKVLEVI